MTDLEDRIATFLHLFNRGKANPVNYGILAKRFKVHDRKVRMAVKRLIEVHGLPIGTSYNAHNGGYYWAETREEIEEVYEKLRNHAISILTRAARLKNVALPKLLDEIQLELREVGSKQ